MAEKLDKVRDCFIVYKVGSKYEGSAIITMPDGTRRPFKLECKLNNKSDNVYLSGYLYEKQRPA